MRPATRTVLFVEASLLRSADEYAMFGSVATVLAWISLVCVLAGSFLEHDSYPGHTLLGHVQTASGAVTFVLASTVSQHKFATKQRDCAVFRRDCVEIEDNVLLAMFNVLFEPVKTALSPGTLLPPLAAYALGLAAAKLTPRSPSGPVNADD